MFILPVLATARTCYSECPPWYERCTRNCADRPWYTRPEYLREIQQSDELWEKYGHYIRRGTVKVVENEQPCYSDCPPWYEICNLKCADRPWYTRPEYLREVKESRELWEKYGHYIRRG